MLTHLKTFNAGVKWAIKVIHSTVNTYIEEGDSTSNESERSSGINQGVRSAYIFHRYIHIRTYIDKERVLT